MQLIIGNKNYSSWSLRPWLLMRQLGLHFEEVKLRLDLTPGSAFYRSVAQHSPAGRVPVLVDDGFAVWDSLAIAEYLHDKLPGQGVWPEDMRQRARARTLAAEMHSGFGQLRKHCPMNIEAKMPEVGARLWAEQPGLRADAERIEVMWAQALAASGGPFLFGNFSAADAMYAPVCTRLLSYGLPMHTTTRAYIEGVMATPAMQAWVEDALAEHDFLDFDEPYRKQP